MDNRQSIITKIIHQIETASEEAGFADTTCVVYGAPDIGKTTLLNRLAEELFKRGDIQPVYFNLQTIETDDNEVAGDKTAQIYLALGRELMEQFELGTEVQEGISAQHYFTAEVIPSVFDSLPPGNKVVTLVDDASLLTETEEFILELKDLASMFQGKLFFIFTLETQPLYATAAFHDIVNEFKLSYFSLPETEQLIQGLDKDGFLLWGERAITEVYTLSGGHPYLAGQLYHAVLDRIMQTTITVKKRVPVTKHQVDGVIPEVLETCAPRLQALWQKLSPEAQELVCKIAALRDGATSDTLKPELNVSDEKLDSLLIRLTDWDILKVTDRKYTVQSELMRQWFAQKVPPTTVELEHEQEVQFNVVKAISGLLGIGLAIAVGVAFWNAEKPHPGMENPGISDEFPEPAPKPTPPDDVSALPNSTSTPAEGGNQANKVLNPTGYDFCVKLTVPDPVLHDIGFSAKGSFLAAGGNKGVYIWNLPIQCHAKKTYTINQLSIKASQDTHTARAVQFHPTQDDLLYTGWENRLRVYSLSENISPHPKAEIPTQAAVWSIATHPNDTVIYAVENELFISQDLKTSYSLHSGSSTIYDVAFHPSKNMLAWSEGTTPVRWF